MSERKKGEREKERGREREKREQERERETAVAPQFLLTTGMASSLIPDLWLSKSSLSKIPPTPPPVFLSKSTIVLKRAF